MAVCTFDDVAERLEKVALHGHYLTASCPFKEKHASGDRHPSFFVYKDGWWKCWSCDTKGKGFEKLMRSLSNAPIAPPIVCKSYNWNEILEDMTQFCNDSNISILKFENLRMYYDKRGVGDRIDPNILGWHDWWYTIPFMSEDAKVVGMIMRASKDIEASAGTKYLIPPNQCMPFVPDWHLLENAKQIFVPFGIFDALTFAVLRLPSVTTTGKPSISSGGRQWQQVVEFLKKFRVPIYVVPDKGEEDGAKWLASELGWRGHVLNLDYPDKIKDSNGFFESGKRNLLESQVYRYAA